MSGLRRAAAELHGLSENDQEWILAALPSSDQISLKAYLAELTDLGFSSDSFIEQKRSSQSNPLPSVPAKSKFGQIYSVSGTTMFSILNGESCSFIAQLLSIYPWLWTNDFLQLLSLPRQNVVRSMLVMKTEHLSIRQQVILKAVNERVEIHISDTDKGSVVREASNTSVDIFSKLFHLIKQWKS